ncbi:Glycogen debranching enzyme [Chitinispirillum alkaliphilum]|nr:Glycogen debranching enzyme [Chitinispirillum alkaliphilum]
MGVFRKRTRGSCENNTSGFVPAVSKMLNLFSKKGAGKHDDAMAQTQKIIHSEMRENMNADEIWPGKPYPRGAIWDGTGTNFSLFSEHAEYVELLLFDSIDATEPVRTVRFPEKSASTWHCYLPGVVPGQLYAYRVYGPYDPSAGHRFNSSKALIDPYARAITGDVSWDDSLFGYKIGESQEDLIPDERDSAPFIPKSVVIDGSFDWEEDTNPQIPWNRTVIYETHVKGMTKEHPDIPENLRGTYLGLASEPVIEHLISLGVTAVELLPVQQHVNDRILVEKGLDNYWGYNTIGFFAPDFRYASRCCEGEQVNEFKQMVKTLHKAGIEVILDVVYNHTAEKDHFGPTLSFKGIDNASYYSLSPENKRFYMDYSGCGGCFNTSHPRVLQFIMDSLRYWVTEMHVDGFRFDLASALAREFYEVDRLSTFFDIICQDPVLSQVKLIAEPWDLGPGGYQVGNFPDLWTEWNGKYRDTMRRYWKGDEGQLSELAFRLTGSSDLYKYSNRNPQASINFITCHDGFTLRDLVSYNDKHNQANKEENRDGANDNDSWNCGVEGHSDDKKIRRLRIKQMKNLLATLFLSQGTPMMLGGDEFGRSKKGNNNTYCQDNHLSWINWELDEEGREILEFVRFFSHLRKEHPVFRRRSFFQGRKLTGRGVKDIHWIKPDGKELKVREWKQSFARSLGVLLVGDAIPDIDHKGHPIVDDSFLILMNAHWEPVDFVLPRAPSRVWQCMVDTDLPGVAGCSEKYKSRSIYELKARSLVLLSSPSRRIL